MHCLENKHQAERFFKKNILKFTKFTSLQNDLFDNEKFWNTSQNLFIEGCTSSGKTMLAVVAMMANMSGGIAPRTLYVVPYKALASQKYQELKSYMGNEANIVLSTGEYRQDDQAAIEGTVDACVIIYEKLFLFLHHNRKIMEKYDLIIMDEFGIVENNDRGIKADIIYNRAVESGKRLIVLSTPYYNWEYYKARHQFITAKQIDRPVKLRETMIYRKEHKRPKINGEGYTTVWRHEIYGDSAISFDGVSGLLEDIVIHICGEHMEKGHSTIVFINNRAWVKDMVLSVYENLLKLGKLTQPTEDELGAYRKELLVRSGLSTDVLNTVFTDEHLAALYKGIGFHNAGLPMELRLIIEQDFFCQNGSLKTIFSTETLAYGINSPTDVVVVADIIGVNGYLTASQYNNYIGRAGRLGITDIGYCYTIMHDKHREKWVENVFKDVKPIESKLFKMSPNEMAIYLLSVFSDETQTFTIDQICERLEVLPHKSPLPNWWRNNVSKAIELLKEAVLLRESKMLNVKKKSVCFFSITLRGLKVRGHILVMESYKKLYYVLKNAIRADNELHLFDMIYAFMSCEEFEKDYIIYPPKQKFEEPPNNWHPFTQFIHLSPNWIEKDHISRKLYDQILDEIRERMDGTKLVKPIGKRKIDPFDLRLWKAIFLMCRLEGVDEYTIQQRTRMENGLGQKLSEQASFFVDCMNVYASATQQFQKHCPQLADLSKALLIGFNPKVLTLFHIPEDKQEDRAYLRDLSRKLLCQEQTTIDEGGCYATV